MPESPIPPSPRVLLTNDDGPPHPTESPYIFGLYYHLSSVLNWDVKVVLPSSQKSWIGAAHDVRAHANGLYFYPKSPDGRGETSDVSRPLKEGEIAEWILLDATPASCANIALHNLYPGEIDLVISGPNLGRNTSAAFALSSGTIGAALSAALSKTKSIALSYGTVIHPTPVSFFDAAHLLSCNIMCHLWEHWGEAGDEQLEEVELYSINVPMIDTLLTDASLPICWTTIWRNSFPRLFKPAQPEGKPTSKLQFRWAPDMRHLITPPQETLPVGCDAWALYQGWVSVTPLTATYGEPQWTPEGKVVKLKL